MSSVLSSVSKIVSEAGLFSWDALLTVYNLFTPNLAKGKVVPPNHPGAGGKWPEYVPPKEGDSRSACPALNAMANHGILPHDGKNISFKDMNHTIRATFNFAPTFCFFVPNYSAKMLHKNYNKDTLDLADLNLHGGIEHDASLTRDDTALQPDQGKPAVHLIKGLLGFATGKDEEGNAVLTVADLARYSGARREQAKATNKEFTMTKFHKMFGSSNSSTLIKFFGGKVKVLEALLIEERLLDGWEPEVRDRMGITIIAFNRTVFAVEGGIPTDPEVLKELVKEAEAAQGRGEGQAETAVAEPSSAAPPASS